MNILKPATVCVLMCALLGVGVAAASESDDLQLERDPAAGSPIRDPLRAWSAASANLPDAVMIRRIAFAHHGVFVFYSPAGSEAVHAQFSSWTGDALEPEPSEERPPGLCTAPGTTPEHIVPALQKVLASTEWAQHGARMDTLVLECHAAELFWMLMPVPEGGYQEGVPISTFELKFDAGNAPQLER